MSKSVIELIGAQIARLRKEREFTQEQLAELVRVSNETISRLERGVSIPSLKTIERISQALNVPLKELFDFEHLSAKKELSTTDEFSRLIAFLNTRDKEDIGLSYRILRQIFRQIEQNYRRKGR